MENMNPLKLRTQCPLVVRWTIGNVSRYGFEALRLSIWGAKKLFPTATHVVCVNSIATDAARELTGEIPDDIIWVDCNGEMPAFIRDRIDGAMAEGVGWKLAPIRLIPGAYELALDNDLILWRLPAALKGWAGSGKWCVYAEDVAPFFGRFARLCPPEPRNSGIRGITPEFDFEGALRSVLESEEARLGSEVDEQGLQTAAIHRGGAPRVVSVEEVSICSPFPPHVPDLGRCGAHFVGVNARKSPWSIHGRPAIHFIHEHWANHLEEVNRKVFGKAGRIKA